MPSVRKVRATYTIGPEIKARLEMRVPPSRRSSFVETSISEALEKLEREAFARFMDNLPTGSEQKGDSTEFIRSRRLELDGRPIDVLEGKPV